MDKFSPQTTMIFRSRCTLLVALSLISFGLILLLVRNWIFDALIAGVYKLGPNSLIFDFWRVPPLLVRIDFYLFNWTNPEDIYNHTIKPHFQEVGPYAFNLDIEKVNITWNSNGTVSFRMHEKYHFDEENSVGRLTDRITTPNTVVLSAAHTLRYGGYLTKKAFSLFLAASSVKLHVTKSADELLFKGYSDPYIDLAQAMSLVSEVKTPVDKAGYLYGRNNSAELLGLFNVATGDDGNMGEIVRWNYNSEAPHYEGSCKKLKGSIGEFFHQKQQRDVINFFLSYAQRNLVLDYEEDVAVRDINGYKFSALHSMLDNGTFAPENVCLCDGECLPVGTINISGVSYGAPAFMSLPHFYDADPVYLTKIAGLHPERSKHEFYFIVEPTLGVSLQVALRFQINFLLQPVEDITDFEDVPTVFLPVLWSNQKATIPAEFAQLLRILLNFPNVIIPAISIFLMLVGLLILSIELRKTKNQILIARVRASLTGVEEVPLRIIRRASWHSARKSEKLLHGA